MTSVKRQIIALIPKLPAEDVPAVMGALKAAAQFKDAPASTAAVDVEFGEHGADYDWLMVGIISYLAKRGTIARSGALFRMKKRKGYKSYAEKLPAVLKYLSRIEKQLKNSKRCRPKLAYICAVALADMLTDWNVFSPGAMLTQIDKLPQAMDRSYPGYMEAGLFRFLFDGMEVPTQ